MLMVGKNIRDKRENSENSDSNFYIDFLYSSRFNEIVSSVLSKDTIFNQPQIKLIFSSFLNGFRLSEDERESIIRILRDEKVTSGIFELIPGDVFDKFKGQYFKSSFNRPHYYLSKLLSGKLNSIEFMKVVFDDFMNTLLEELDFSTWEWIVKLTKKDITGMFLEFEDERLIKLREGDKYMVIGVKRDDNQIYKYMLYNKTTQKIERDIYVFGFYSSQ